MFQFKPAKSERRYKVLSVAPELLLSGLFDVGAHRMNLRVQGLPEDGLLEITDVCYSWDRRSFLFRLWHPEWPELGECAVCPDAEVRFVREESKPKDREFL